jgi:hypothetical protein
MVAWGAYIIATASPGPAVVAIISTAISRGRNAGLALAFGVLTGSYTWAMLAAAGLSALISTYGNALFVLKIAGGLYLLWLAFKALKAAMRKETEAVLPPREAAALAAPSLLQGSRHPPDQPQGDLFLADIGFARHAAGCTARHARPDWRLHGARHHHFHGLCVAVLNRTRAPRLQEVPPLDRGCHGGLLCIRRLQASDGEAVAYSAAAWP